MTQSSEYHINDTNIHPRWLSSSLELASLDDLGLDAVLDSAGAGTGSLEGLDDLEEASSSTSPKTTWRPIEPRGLHGR